MPSIGGDLQQARERAGLSLQDLSARTKIRRVFLEAIERDDFRRLPGGILTRGHLRAYAREVRLDPDQIVQRYRSEFEPDTAPLEPALKSAVDAPVSRAPRHKRMLIPGLLAAMAILFFGLYQDQTEEEPLIAVATTGQQPATQSDDVPGPTPEGIGGDEPRVIRQGIDGDVLSIDIRPTSVVWVDARADGKRVLYGLIQPDESRLLSAREELFLRVGDAAAFRYSLNGVRGRMAGAPGEVREIRITRQNYSTFQEAERDRP
jgi:transcriptional regulator with XRE-family HTH domain